MASLHCHRVIGITWHSFSRSQRRSVAEESLLSEFSAAPDGEHGRAAELIAAPDGGHVSAAELSAPPDRNMSVLQSSVQHLMLNVGVPMGNMGIQ